MAVFKCKMCGAPLDFEGIDTIANCQYCKTKQTLPRFLDDRRAELYDRAGYFRRNNEFDKASGIYEYILSEDKMDAEAYWSIVLCRYGIEYVEDPITKKRVPTINRMQVASLLMDEDYKSALSYADEKQKEVYKAEAEEIARIQKECLAISQKEEPFDVFICYKETDENGNRTQDSVLAQELYYNLTGAGYKTFFARVTLEKILGCAYEPYIFAALNSAKVMVVVGTKPENFNAVWVKNEWSRYLAMIKNGEKKTIIPAYRGMNPYDLPEAFSYLQAQDMAKIGFLQDIIAGIRKLVGVEQKKTDNANLALTNMLKRIRMAIADGDFGDAENRIEKALDIDAENSDLYLYKLLCQLHLKEIDLLAEGTVKNYTNNPNYRKAYKFGSTARKQFLENCVSKSSVRWSKETRQEKQQELEKRFHEKCQAVQNLKEKILAKEDEVEELKKKVENSRSKVPLARVGYWMNFFSAIVFLLSFAAVLVISITLGVWSFKPGFLLMLAIVGMLVSAVTTLVGNFLMFVAIKSSFFFVILTVLYNVGGLINQIKTSNYIKKVKSDEQFFANVVSSKQNELNELKTALANEELELNKDREELKLYDEM